MRRAVEPGCERKMMREISLAVAVGGEIGPNQPYVRQQQLRRIPDSSPTFVSELLGPVCRFQRC